MNRTVQIKKISGVLGSGLEYFAVEQFSALPYDTAVLLVGDENLDTAFENCKSFQKSGAFSVEVLLMPSDESSVRLKTIRELCAIRDDKKVLVVTSVEALFSKTFSKNGYLTSEKQITRGGLHPDIITVADALGYKRSEFVEEVGEFARRGEIFDLWPPSEQKPFRVLFDGDAVEEIRTFNSETQLTENFVSNFVMTPAKEKSESVFAKWFKTSAAFCSKVVGHDTLEQLRPSFKLIYLLDALDPVSTNMNFRNVNYFGGDIKRFLKEISRYRDYKKQVFYRNKGELGRFEEILAAEKKVQNNFEYVSGGISEGFVNDQKKLFILPIEQFFLNSARPRFKAVKSPVKRSEGIWELSTGDFVVHVDYGIGKYICIRHMDEPPQEFVEIEYRHNDKLYVPVYEFFKIKKHIGVEGIKPKLSDLDTRHIWEKTKRRASDAAAEFAKELVQMYASRAKTSAPSLTETTTWERELEESFPYDETTDQKTAIDDVLTDLTRHTPMERLILGDVGFGKTEVALRAAFKAVVNSYQVAVIVPTTILAMQHYARFCERLSMFPVNVAVLHRFQSRRAQSQTVKDINHGLADIVIGTHRMFSKDVNFKNLGLLIVDEEHRFGVQQKEKIRQLRENVHTLYMSATPIPRTLASALNGIKDISVIESPPIGRKPIETIIDRLSLEKIKNAVYSELARGGQVFYIHNRIDEFGKKLREITAQLPGVKWGIIHGRMSSREVEGTLYEFYRGNLECLLATTIVEAGIDIPQVNTIIIDNAQNFGLAQLYQLRGRVGRENKKAYCYLFYEDRNMTEEAQRRLEALREFSTLGSGYNLARRDLEIRGAGSFFGYRQHGFLTTVGFELYAKMISAAASALKNNAPGGHFILPVEIEPIIEIDYPAFIPKEYIEQDNIRMSFYRKFLSASSEDEVGALLSELIDRFGRAPYQVKNIADLAGFRLFLKSNKILEIKETPSEFAIRVDERMDITPEGLKEIIAKFCGNIIFSAGKEFKIRKILLRGDKLIFLKNILQKLLKFATITSR